MLYKLLNIYAFFHNGDVLLATGYFIRIEAQQQVWGYTKCELSVNAVC